MVVDSSALIALIMDERLGWSVADALTREGGGAVGAPTLVETAMVLAGRHMDGPAQAESAISHTVAWFDLRLVEFGERHWWTAFHAFSTFGKGRHPAALNLGDCLTYAVAKLAGQPLLCVGNDFAQTDLELVPLEG